ncbi:MAG: hypothetical protein M1819_004898 [Sarea resinae]|nr:MAG: hypothetical protein M1819_004898 [Sarea resinae]
MAEEYTYKRRSIGEEPVTSVLPDGDIPLDVPHNKDEEVLEALGYKAEFKREFTLWSSFAVSFAVLGLLPSFATTMGYGMGYAGTAGMVWGWLIAMVFIQCVAMSMAELCSSMPTSGGLYYASAVLAPPGWGPFAAWITGWSNWIGQITGAPSVNYGNASMILAAASISHPTYTPTNYQTFLLTVLLMLIHATISSCPTKRIAQINGIGSTLNVIFLIVVIIMVPAGTKREHPKFNASKDVWGDIYQGTAYPSGVSILMSFIGVIWTMSGYDAPFHLSEETARANVNSPRAIVLTSGVGGLFGWFLQLVVAYTVIDIPSVLESDLGQPWAAFLLQVMPKKIALAALGLTVVCGFSMGQGCMVAASRVTFAYARDGCFPYSNIWSRVNKHTQTPVNAVWFNTALGICMLFLIFGGSVAIGALFSIAAIAAFVAFTIPIFIRVFFVGDRFRKGPWNLGRFSRTIGAMASAFVALMAPILCLPSVTGSNLKANEMNWTCLVYGAPMLSILIWWFVDAHKWFKGPKVNVEHLMLGRDANVVEGIEKDEGSSGSDTDIHKGPSEKIASEKQ